MRFRRTSMTSQPASISIAPISSPAAWTGTDLSRSDEWIYHLSPDEIAESHRIAAGVREIAKPLTSLTAEDVPLGALAPAAREWRETLHKGRGFTLIRGLPVESMTRD